eukprot:480831-Pelagomonas_calceolata.AAC.1
MLMLCFHKDRCHCPTNSTNLQHTLGTADTRHDKALPSRGKNDPPCLGTTGSGPTAAYAGGLWSWLTAQTGRVCECRREIGCRSGPGGRRGGEGVQRWSVSTW